MSWRSWLCVAILLPLAALPALPAGEAKKAGKGKFKITWKKTVLDRAFRSEGVAVADVNKDGKPDVLVGDFWYEAPDWKRHVIRQDRKFDPKGYSQSFACWADDFNGDGWPDLLVIGFPGAPCHWYENPRGKPGPWKQHFVWHSACNETPLFADLFGTGKRVLVMSWQPKGKEHEGQMAWFRPGKDPTQPWEMHPISEPSSPKKEIPGTFKYAHGLGVGDVNGDGRADVLCTGGWWEQPAKDDGKPWRFHPVNLGPNCADMHAYDVDGDGLPDIISSSAHNTGLWWHQQRKGKTDPSFVRFDFFPTPPTAAKLPKDSGLSKDETALFEALNKARGGMRRAPWKIHRSLCDIARKTAESQAKGLKLPEQPGYPGALRQTVIVAGAIDATRLAKDIFAKPALQAPALLAPNLEIGVGVHRNADGTCFCVLVLGDRKQFALFSQSHALHCVDINGDGVKDLVTGRRWWAHGPTGDDTPADPAYLYWFEARRDRSGQVRFIPHPIDDDSGVGTQFAVIDLNGDGLLDVIISNKKGVFVFEQVRTKEE